MHAEQMSRFHHFFLNTTRFSELSHTYDENEVFVTSLGSVEKYPYS